MTTKLFPLLAFLFLFTEESAHAFGKRPLADALDTEIQALYPIAGQSAAVVTAACEKLRNQARARGARTLVIGYEGLASFDSTGTHVGYRQHLQALRGQTVEPMRRGSGGYLLHGLLARIMKDRARDTEVLVFPHTATGSGAGSAPEVCAEVWMREPGNELALLGHSYGGHAAAQLVEALARKNIPIAAVITADPRLKGYIGNLNRTPNVKLWENYFQRNTPFLNGYQVNGADLNSNLSSTGVGHVGVPFSPVLRQALDRVLQ